jgi:hypothetical protein
LSRYSFPAILEKVAQAQAVARATIAIWFADEAKMPTVQRIRRGLAVPSAEQACKTACKLYEHTSVVITTNLGLSESAGVFGDAKMTTALFDRADAPLPHHGDRKR